MNREKCGGKRVTAGERTDSGECTSPWSRAILAALLLSNFYLPPSTSNVTCVGKFALLLLGLVLAF